MTFLFEKKQGIYFSLIINEAFVEVILPFIENFS
jgi:hypothetical protein